MLEGHVLPVDQLRHFIEVAPKLDFKALQPGRSAEDAIHKAAADLKLKDKFGATVSLTGQVPMNDDQFSVIRNSALRDTLTAILGVLIVLWLALRSIKIIVAVFFSLMVGLAATAALGLAMVGSFNLISIAFFVLFVGLGVDFGIQFSVRYRSERHDHRRFGNSVEKRGAEGRQPLALAAAATAVGFFAFLPTSYRGLSELGLIAGCGMLIAFACSITLVPAMLMVLNPPGEAAAVGFKGLAPLDDFLQRHRVAVIFGTILVVLAGAPLLWHLPFDFNPIDLQNPNSPSVVTYRRIAGRPADQRQRCRSAGAVTRTGRYHRQASLNHSRSLARPDPEQLRAQRSGAKNRRPAGSLARPRSRAQSAPTTASPRTIRTTSPRSAAPPML